MTRERIATVLTEQQKTQFNQMLAAPAADDPIDSDDRQRPVHAPIACTER